MNLTAVVPSWKGLPTWPGLCRRSTASALTKSQGIRRGSLLLRQSLFLTPRHSRGTPRALMHPAQQCPSCFSDGCPRNSPDPPVPLNARGTTECDVCCGEGRRAPANRQALVSRSGYERNVTKSRETAAASRRTAGLTHSQLGPISVELTPLITCDFHIQLPFDRPTNR